MNLPIDSYPSKSLLNVSELPVATAKFDEPVFKLGQFQDRYIEVTVQVYPLTYQDVNGKTLVGVRFGEMNSVRFINRDLLYDVEPLTSEG